MSFAHHQHKTRATMASNDTTRDAVFLENTPVITELHRSHVTRLETEELLKECRLDLAHVKWHTAAQQYISAINTVLEGLESNINTSVSRSTCPLPLQADKLPDVIQLPQEALQVEYHPFHSIGMTTKQGNAKQLPLLQCNIVLPDSLWNGKDYLHHRYFSKRNLILWHVLQHLDKHSNVVGTVEWRCSSGNERHIVIVLTPPVSERGESTSNKKKKKKRKKQQQSRHNNEYLPKKTKFQVEISLKMESSDWIPPTRLFPNRSNLGNAVQQTPIYNAALMRDCMKAMDEEEALSSLPSSIQDALVLLKVWCLQRGFLGGHDSFRGVQEIAYLLLYLLRTKRVTPRMAPLEIITAWFKFVSESKWLDGAACVMPLENISEQQTIQQSQQAALYAQHAKDSPVDTDHGDPPSLLECFQQHTDGPVLLNSSMTWNVWGSMSPSFIQQLEHAAAASLECLHTSSTASPFSFLFLQEARFYSCMDAVISIPLESLYKQSENNNMDSSWFDGIARNVVRVLGKALGDRVKLICILTTGNGRIQSLENPSQVPVYNVNPNTTASNDILQQSPTGDSHLVLGLSLNPETCHRVVDRGPPAEDIEATNEFLELWGSQKAQLRRFKDGAIVHAVVWNDSDSSNSTTIRMQGDDKSQGGIVERIVHHIINLHFLKSHGDHKKKKHGAFPKRQLQFALRDVTSLVDGVATSSHSTTSNSSQEQEVVTNATTAFKSAMSAFSSLSEFLRQNSSPTIAVEGSADAKTSRLGIPLAIDAVEPLSPTLRYSELFPPVPIQTLGGPRSGSKKVSGVAPAPILIQIRFGLSSKWPTDLKAMAAAKTAMLIQLADGIESLKRHSSGFEGEIQVTPSYMDVGYKGYAWRIIVRADPELNMLRKLQQPSHEAVSLLRILTREHVMSAMHHSMIHAIHTLHPSSGSVVRLAKRWVATHLLSDLIPFEAIELLVAKVYTNHDVPLDAPATVVSGFLRFLNLLASHNWSRQPLVIDPHGHLTEDDHADIVAQFEHARGPDFKNGPPMYIISPNDRIGGDNEEADSTTKSKSKTPSIWTPTFTHDNPEVVVLSRAAALAKRSHDFLLNALSNNETVDWSAVFHETPSSFKSYSALLRIDADFVMDKECSSTSSDLSIRRNDDNVLESSFTRSMRVRSLGPKALRRKVYRNLNAGDDIVLYDWRPVEEMVQALRNKFGSLALFFYNELAPEVICMLWRPTSFVPHAFSAMNSEYVVPVDAEGWKSDSLVIHNTSDVLREMSQYTDGIIADVKVLNDPTVKARPVKTKQGSRKRSADDRSDDLSSSSGDGD